MTVWFHVGDTLDWIEAHGRVTGVPRVTVELFLACHRHALPGDGVVPCVLDPNTDSGLVGAEADATAEFLAATRGDTDGHHHFTSPDGTSSPVAGDIVLFTGIVWTRAYAHLFERLVSLGIRCCVYIHDIIPIERPDLVGEADSRAFSAWLEVVLATASIVFVSSEANRDMVLRWAVLAGLRSPTPVIVAGYGTDHLRADPLGANIQTVLSATGIETTNFVLCVGTVDKRKNQTALLKVWTRLADRLAPERVPQLILAGRNNLPHGALDAAPRGKVVNLQGLSDIDLAALYASCLFTTFPSLSEGYGLPVAESLVWGKLCVASRLATIEEQAGDLVWYVDPVAEDDCYSAIHTAITRPDLRRAAEDRIRLQCHPRPWGDVSTLILDRMKQ